mmetsp:Transcript_10060/g.8852  ORF Transcript_10060/g.8852 Transcript_10060/m.8852 type:complete len:99 (+) Transcript_10060:690-986(+)
MAEENSVLNTSSRKQTIRNKKNVLVLNKNKWFKKDKDKITEAYLDSFDRFMININNINNLVDNEENYNHAFRNDGYPDLLLIIIYLIFGDKLTKLYFE